MGLKNREILNNIEELKNKLNDKISDCENHKNIIIELENSKFNKKD